MSRRRPRRAEPKPATVIRPDLPAAAPCAAGCGALVSPRFTGGATTCTACRKGADASEGEGA